MRIPSSDKKLSRRNDVNLQRDLVPLYGANILQLRCSDGMVVHSDGIIASTVTATKSIAIDSFQFDTGALSVVHVS